MKTDKLFFHSIRGENVFFKYARGVSDRSGKEFHIYHELILFQDGDAEFISEELHMRVKPGTLIVIPKETYHQMVIHGEQQRYCRCVLQFDDGEEAARIMPVEPRRTLAVEADQQIRYLFEKLMEAAKSDAPHARQLLKAVLVLLLDALVSRKDGSDDSYSQNETVQLAVEYINRNLYGPLTVQQIAQACNTSPSSLAHIFKREMYCSVHKFIVKKRLISAYHRIAAGEAATVVAVECGFRDYSGFYKQYKKAFGRSPSQIGDAE